MTKELSRICHYCGVNGVKPSDLTEEMIKRICAGEFDPPCIKGCVKTSTMTYQEWDKLIAKANKIDDLKFPDKQSKPTKNAQFGMSFGHGIDDVLKLFNISKDEYIKKKREEEYKVKVRDKKFNWIKSVSGIGLLLCGFILGWLTHGQ